jgi:hypothetical protein
MISHREGGGRDPFFRRMPGFIASPAKKKDSMRGVLFLDSEKTWVQTVQVLPELNNLPRSAAGDFCFVASICARTPSV